MLASRTSLQTIALGLILTSGAFAQEAVRVDLKTAKTYAADRNARIRSLRLAVEEAKAKRERLRSAFLPRIGIAGGGEAEANLDESASSPIGYFYGNYNLFNGFRDTHAARGAELEIEKADAELRAIEHEVGVDVERTFHAFIYRKNLIELKDAALARNESHQALVKRSRQMGSISEADVMEFDLGEAALKSDMVALKQELEDTRSELKLLLGEEVGSKVQPIGELHHEHLAGSINDYLQLLRQKNPKLAIAARDIEIAREDLRVTEGRNLPQVDFETRIGVLPRDERITEAVKPQASVVLLAKMDLYTGREVAWEQREKELRVSRREFDLRDQINTTIREVEVAFRNLKVLETRADLERNVLRDARRYYEAIVTEYRRGFKTSGDLQSATERWAEAEVRRVTLDYEFIKLRLDIERLLGAPINVTVMPPPAPEPPQKGRKP